jgi:hypothetical protein
VIAADYICCIGCEGVIPLTILCIASDVAPNATLKLMNGNNCGHVVLLLILDTSANVVQVLGLAEYDFDPSGISEQSVSKRNSISMKIYAQEHFENLCHPCVASPMQVIRQKWPPKQLVHMKTALHRHQTIDLQNYPSDIRIGRSHKTKSSYKQDDPSLRSRGLPVVPEHFVCCVSVHCQDEEELSLMYLSTVGVTKFRRRINNVLNEAHTVHFLTLQQKVNERLSNYIEEIDDHGLFLTILQSLNVVHITPGRNPHCFPMIGVEHPQLVARK